MMSYYLDKGQDIDKLCNLSGNEKSFYKASMLFNIERQIKEKQDFLKVLIGVING